MNYISIFSLLLGIISIYIALKYTEQYDKVNDIKQSNELSGIITNILSDIEIKTEELPNILIKNKEEFIRFFKDILKKNLNSKENFVNYNYYLNKCQRGICSTNDDKNNLSSQTNKNFHLKSNFDYKDELMLANNSINKNDIENSRYFTEIDNRNIDTKNSESKKLNYKLDNNHLINSYDYNNVNQSYAYENLSNIMKSDNISYRKGKCIDKYGNKIFSRFVHEPKYCLGKYKSCR